MEKPTEVFNCEYFENLKRKMQDPTVSEAEKQLVRKGLSLMPEGYRILGWMDRPFVPEPRDRHTISKFDQ